MRAPGPCLWPWPPPAPPPASPPPTCPTCCHTSRYGGTTVRLYGCVVWPVPVTYICLFPTQARTSLCKGCTLYLLWVNGRFVPVRSNERPAQPPTCMNPPYLPTMHQVNVSRNSGVLPPGRLQLAPLRWGPEGEPDVQVRLEGLVRGVVWACGAGCGAIDTGRAH